MHEAWRSEQSIAPPKHSNDGKIYESSGQLHWNDITSILDVITLYHMSMRADSQFSKQDLQVSMIISDVISNVVTFLTKGAHMLVVLHRLHPSALLTTDTGLKLSGVSSNDKNIGGGT